ncbi:hypothetical protein N9L68_06740 [bacterium]|nr:hypothetical protein [bacterium]
MQMTSDMDYEAQNNGTVSVPQGAHTCESNIERRDHCDELLAPAEEENPEAGPSEEDNSHEGSRGLGQHGDPEEREVIVIEEAEPRVEAPYRASRVLRSPRQKEIQQLRATHLPHADWCDVCMKGRGRNKAHRKRDVE